MMEFFQPSLRQCCGLPEALKMYSQAIAGAETDHTLFGNRSAAYLALGLYEEALQDAQKAVALCPTWAKGHYRCEMKR